MASYDPFDVAEECVAFAIRRASRLVTSHYEGFLGSSGMHITQFTILNALKALGQITINELAGQLETDRTTLSRNLRPLLERGWLEKKRGPDARCRLLRLSAAGSAALETATAAWSEAQSAMRTRLGRRLYRDLMADLAYLEEVLAKPAA